MSLADWLGLRPSHPKVAARSQCGWKRRSQCSQTSGALSVTAGPCDTVGVLYVLAPPGSTAFAPWRSWCTDERRRRCRESGNRWGSCSFVGRSYPGQIRYFMFTMLYYFYLIQWPVFIINGIIKSDDNHLRNLLGVHAARNEGSWSHVLGCLLSQHMSPAMGQNFLWVTFAP